MRRAPSWSVSPRAVPRMSRYCPTLSSMRSSSHTARTGGAVSASSWSAYTWARSPMRIATPSPKRRASPRHTAASCRSPKARCAVRSPAPRRGAVHDVVVHEREGLEHLEGGAGLDHRGVVVAAAGGAEAPVAERRPEPLAAAHHERAQRLERRHEVAARARPSGAVSAVSKRVEALLHPLGHREEARRHRDRRSDHGPGIVGRRGPSGRSSARRRRRRGRARRRSG